MQHLFTPTNDDGTGDCVVKSGDERTRICGVVLTIGVDRQHIVRILGRCRHSREQRLTFAPVHGMSQKCDARNRSEDRKRLIGGAIIDDNDGKPQKQNFSQ